MALHSSHTRDAAMRELRRINRWMIAGSVILTGLLSDVAANAFPGRSAKGASGTQRKGAAHHKHHSHAGSSGVLRPPAQAPKASVEVPAQSEEAPAAAQAPAEAPPAEEAQPAPEAQPTQEAHTEAAPAQEPEAAPEESSPVVSGGS